MSQLNSIPDWMKDNDYPIPEVQEYVRKLKEAEAQSKRNIQDVSVAVPASAPTPPPSNQSPTSESTVKEQEGVNLTEGTVFLIWKDNASDDVSVEDNKFPTVSSFSVSSFKDFDNIEEMKQHVKEFQNMIEEYNQKSIRKGTYAVVVGRLVKGMKKKVIEVVDVEF